MTMLDPVLLRTFVAASRAPSFSEAGRRLGLGQSTVSQHIQKLETATGRRLFLRDTHSVQLTADGEALMDLARAILDAHGRAERYFAGSELRGRVRFGTSEDFVLTRLPDVLAEFRSTHPSVDLELTVGLSGVLYQQLDSGELDLIFCKRRAGDERGRTVWRERLAWVGSERIRLDPERPVPLILLPPPSVTRAIALDALTRAGRAWRVACTSGSLAGLGAAARAGLGVIPQSPALIIPGLSVVPPAGQLPALGEIEFVVVGSTRHLRGPAAALADQLIANADQVRRPG